MRSAVKFLVDTANLEEIREANDMGVLDGGPFPSPSSSER